MIGKLTYAPVAFVALGLWLPTALVADTIVLKNGRRIKADHVYEEDTRVTYWTAAGELSLPKSLIDRVIKEEGPSPGALAAPPLSNDLLSPLPGEDASATDGQASSSALKNGRINFDYLAKVENDLLRNPNPQAEEKFVKTYYEVTAFLLKQGSLGEASDRARHAAALLPRSLPLAINLGVLLTRRQRFSEAIAHLQPAAKKISDSPEIFMLLGSAYYYTEKMDQAVQAWTRSLDLKENPAVREALQRAQKERSVDGNYRQSSSGHFLIKYEGAQGQALGRDILQTLERHYRDLIRELDYDPPETIVVILYPNQTFGDLTRTPGWVGALNDGKLRIPVSGLSSVTGELSRVLKHELAHSFVQQITQGRCPVWLNEGVAQLVEGASSARSGGLLSRAYSEHRFLPLERLEKSFMGLSPQEASLAYAESLAAAEYLRDTYGFSTIVRMLKRIPTSPSFSALLQSSLRTGYDDLEIAVARFVARRYGL